MSSQTSVFDGMEAAPSDAVFNVLAKYKEDAFPQKVNLSVGAYRDEEGQPWVLPVVKTVETQMSSDVMLNHEYLPIDGLESFTESATRLVLGSDGPAVTQNRYCSIQCLSGTGSIRAALELIRKFLEIDTIYISNPTWSNHRGIASNTGFTQIREYRYFDPTTRGLDIEGMIQDLKSATEGSAVILQTCAHNPTGVDPSKEEWKRIFEVLKERSLFPCTICFILDERVGQLCCVLTSPEMAGIVLTQLKVIARRLWSNPPHHGARIVATALNNSTLYQEWIDNITTMTGRIKKMREELYQRLVVLGTPGDWTHILKQIGMFTYTGLNTSQVDVLVKKYHIYLLSSGRINICGLNYGNLDYVANAIHEVVVAGQ
ncbi:PREDICTED: aspartate aminotransferase, cytoplasmic-like [Amphimedon queenslandica]|uniref:aspartate transaminase n=1 Tax=Amphimedon queenslandica TaxID=400682 RepID=A0AAN0JSY1_AMPQE|nr:PREDICTED: aspartate aminotransferase, cytoplasmic-like [Amphimedon queenslandica]|eukprot:XP_019860150.1 PREDICTED: aspartate aminotransferase, cytoplasmic-like [Amphimedon queenslandica]